MADFLKENVAHSFVAKTLADNLGVIHLIRLTKFFYFFFLSRWPGKLLANTENYSKLSRGRPLVICVSLK